jgi:hypothetical protein
MDERRRNIEREHSRSAGDAGVDVAALAERVRRGDVQADAIRVAALLGDTRARDVVPAGVKVEPGDLLAVVSALKAAPAPVIARAAIAVARAGVRPAEATLQAVLRAAEAWVLCPCKEHDAALTHAGESLGAHPLNELALLPGWSKKALSRMVAWSDGPAALAAADVLAALRADLVPWLLGDGDPVHARAGAPGQVAPLPPESIPLRDPPPPPVGRPAAPPPELVTDPELEREVDKMIEAQGDRHRRVLRGRAAPPSPAEMLAETFTKLAQHAGLAGAGFVLESASARGAVITRTQGEWTEALHFAGHGSADMDGVRASARPKPAVLSHGKLAAWRQAHGSRSREPEVMTHVPLRLAKEWDVADPLEANRFIDEVVARVTKLVLPRLARLRDPEDMLHELLDLTRGPRGFSVADVEVLTCLAGKAAPREYVRRWRVKDPRNPDLAEVVARLGLT